MASIFKLVARNYHGPRPVWDLPWLKMEEPCQQCGVTELYRRNIYRRCYACGWSNETTHVMFDSRQVFPD